MNKIIAPKEMTRESLTGIREIEEIKSQLLSGKVEGVGFKSKDLREKVFNDDFKIFKVESLLNGRYIGTDYYVVFNLKNIANKKEITLEVPKYQSALFLSNSNRNTTFWTEELGVRFIRVVESEAT